MNLNLTILKDSERPSTKHFYMRIFGLGYNPLLTGIRRLISRDNSTIYLHPMALCRNFCTSYLSVSIRPRCSITKSEREGTVLLRKTVKQGGLYVIFHAKTPKKTGKGAKGDS